MVVGKAKTPRRQRTDWRDQTVLLHCSLGEEEGSHRHSRGWIAHEDTLAFLGLQSRTSHVPPTGPELHTVRNMTHCKTERT